MVVTGKEIYIQEDWTGEGDWYTLAGSKSCQIKGDCEEIEITSRDTGEWYTALAGHDEQQGRHQHPLRKWRGCRN